MSPQYAFRVSAQNTAQTDSFESSVSVSEEEEPVLGGASHAVTSQQAAQLNG